MFLSKSDLDITFFWDSPNRAVSIKNEVLIRHDSIVFIFNFPSFKTNLDFNQDGNYILDNFDKFETMEMNDEYAMDKFQNLDIPESNLNNVTIILNLPKGDQQIYQNVALEIDESRLIFNLK